MQYRAEVTIELKPGMLDPEGTTIRRALEHLGYHTNELRTSKRYIIDLEEESSEMAEKKVDEMCQKLIANPIIHNYTIDMREA